MRMTRMRRAILDRLKAGPCGTAQLCIMLDRDQCVIWMIMDRMRGHGFVVNTGTDKKAMWELVK